MMVLGDLSGIQSYLLDVSDSGGERPVFIRRVRQYAMLGGNGLDVAT